MRSAVFLDRDGVLTVPQFSGGRSFAPRNMDDFKLYPEARTCLSRLKDEGFVLIVVTNQPDIAEGLMDQVTLDAMHQQMSRELPIDAIKVCTHSKQANCSCRKPRPGMLRDAARELQVDCTSSFMIGDRSSDIEAGASAGCRTIFIDLGYTAEAKPDHADRFVTSLSEATEWILATTPGSA